MENFLRDWIFPALVSIIVGLASGYLGVRIAVAEASLRIQFNEVRIHTLERSHQHHVNSDGHPTAMERLRSHERRLEALEAK